VSALAIVAFFVALLAIILIHEFGHYLLARRFGFRVLEYFVGFGPKLWSFRRGEIEYGLKAIPAGGYVKIAGMNPFENDVPPGDEDRAYGAKPVRQRALVILAGPLSHFLVAAIIFSGAAHDDRRDRSDPRVRDLGRAGELEPGRPSPAAVAGSGRVTSSPGWEIWWHPPPPRSVPMSPARARGDPGAGPAREPDREPDHHPGRAPSGYRSAEREARDRARAATPRVLPRGRRRRRRRGEVHEGVDRQIGHAFGPQGVVRVFHLLFEGAPRNQGDVASVVGVSQQVGAIGATGNWAAFFWVFAYVTLFIGIINLVPLPPFDGGHLAILLIEKARGRKIDMRKIVPVSAAVLLFLGFFVISTMVLDIWKPVPIGP
jgi:Predicted membrane-associated Zn-dependent proteases 1